MPPPRRRTDVSLHTPKTPGRASASRPLRAFDFAMRGVALVYRPQARRLASSASSDAALAVRPHGPRRDARLPGRLEAGEGGIGRGAAQRAQVRPPSIIMPVSSSSDPLTRRCRRARGPASFAGSRTKRPPDGRMDYSLRSIPRPKQGSQSTPYSPLPASSRPPAMPAIGHS